MYMVPGMKRSKPLEIKYLCGLEVLKHVLKILVKIGRVSINEVRFGTFIEFSENFNGDRGMKNLADLR